MNLAPGSKILFIGDSITDADRLADPEGLGNGYVRRFSEMMRCSNPASALEVVNRGVGGDTIRDLASRWQRDALDEAPDVLSVSIGVNDVWRQLQEPPNPDEVFLEEFEATYRTLLEKTLDTVPCRLILCEPSINGETRGTAHNRLTEPYVECVHQLANEYDALLVRMNAAFWTAIDANPDMQWTTDGVHPTSDGHMLMAMTLFDAFCAAFDGK